ncbi:MAG: carbamoyltransferase family protein [Planctomycetia bacterium]
MGISAFYHDAAAALVVDGDIVAVAQEERFTRLKHDPAFPTNAVDFCLRQAGLKASDLNYVVFYEKPLGKFERLLETYLAFAPAGYRSFRLMLPTWLGKKLHLPREFDRALSKGAPDGFRGRYVFTDHHESHAASAFLPSPFDEAAILTMDGVGEWSTTCFGVGRGRTIELTHEIRFPHSLGLLYSAFTYYTGFKVNSGEYKLMGLAPYGRPIHRDLILQHLVDLKDDGSLRLNMDYFNYCSGLTMTSRKFHRLFGGPPRRPESKLTQREMDLAASVQAVAEEAVLSAARHVRRTIGLRKLVLAGGVALNCVANGRILQEGIFDDVWIQPAAGDAGGALGAALFVWHQLLENDRLPRHPDAQHGSLLGPGFTDDEIEAFLKTAVVEHERAAGDDELCDMIVDALADEKIVGWFQGRMEFGPRALGARSFLGDPRSPRMQSTMNLKIKFRESFRPFAPAVLQEDAADYFDLPPGSESPYMLTTAGLRSEHRVDPGPRYDEAFGIDKLNYVRSKFPAVAHVDGSARVQTVDGDRNPLFHRLLTKFRERTGCPMLVNTSFNVRGEPIVCTPTDAYRCFLATDVDVLAMGRCIIRKKHPTPTEQRERHLAGFALD